MQIPVLIEPVANNGFRASSGGPLSFAAEGATTQDAILNLLQLMNQALLHLQLIGLTGR